MGKKTGGCNKNIYTGTATTHHTASWWMHRKKNIVIRIKNALKMPKIH